MHHHTVLLEADVHVVVAMMVDLSIAEHPLEAHLAVHVETHLAAALILDHTVAAAVVAHLTGVGLTPNPKPAACGLDTVAKVLAADSAEVVDLLVDSGIDRTDHSPLVDELADYWAVVDVASSPKHNANKAETKPARATTSGFSLRKRGIWFEFCQLWLIRIVVSIKIRNP